MSAALRASVVVPSHKRPAAIAACAAALQRQDAAGIEIVVVDDGSPVPVAGLPDGPHPLRVIRQANAGPGAARNRGAAEARGALLCFTDDDCLPDPGWVSALLAAAAGAGPRPVMLGGSTRNVAPGPFAAASQDMADHLAAGGGFFPSNNLALPRGAFLALGGFPAGYPLAAGEDRALCRAWAAAGHGFLAVPGATVSHRHDLTLQGFWRQHRNYGRGAQRFHAGNPAGRDGETGGRSGPGFYARLVSTPLRRGGGKGALTRSALIGLAQAATLAGYLAETRASRRDDERSSR